MNWELSDVQAVFRKGRGTRDQIANIHWITEKAREFQKNIYFWFIDYAKAFDCVDHNAAAAAKSHQSCPTLCDPIDSSPPGSTLPGILQARILEWVSISFSNKLWKILKEMGIPDHVTCILRNLYAGQEATVRTEHETTDWFQIGKGVHQGCILSSCLFNLYAEYIMRNAGLEEAQAGIQIARRNINNLRYADGTTLMAKWRRTKRPLDESERGEWKKLG